MKQHHALHKYADRGDVGRGGIVGQPFGNAPHRTRKDEVPVVLKEPRSTQSQGRVLVNRHGPTERSCLVSNDAAGHDVPITVAGCASVSKSTANTIRVYPHKSFYAIGRIILLKAVQSAVLDVPHFRAAVVKQGEHAQEVQHLRRQHDGSYMGIVSCAGIPVVGEPEFRQAKRLFQDVLASGSNVAEDAVAQPAGLSRQSDDSELGQVVPAANSFHGNLVSRQLPAKEFEGTGGLPRIARCNR